MDTKHRKSSFISFLQSRPLTIDLLTAMAMLLIFTVSVIAWYSYIESKKAIYTLLDQLVNSVSNVVAERTVHFLEPASTMAQMTGRITGSNTLDFTGVIQTGRLESYMIEVLRAYPQLSMFYYATENGDYLMARKERDSTISTTIIDMSQKPPVQTVKERTTDGEIIAVNTSTDVDFDPRTRPWYIGAKQTGKQFWTDVYIFHTGDEPGITASFPEMNNEGIVTGVIGVDIVLESLSDFLKSVDIARQGALFIVNTKDELIASSEPIPISRRHEQSYRLVKITELGDSFLDDFYARYQQTGLEKVHITVDSVRFVGIIRPFSYIFKKWKIGVLIRSELFTQPLDTANMIVLTISIVVLILALLVSVLLSRSISRPIMYLADQTKKIKDMYLDEPLELKSHIREVQIMRDAIQRMKAGLTAFNKYVPSELVRELISSDLEVKLGGERKELTILFSDIQGFTSISETMPHEELMLHVSEYLTELTPVLLDNDATVDKFIGDSIMAFWGAPKPDEYHALHACRTTLLCLRKVSEMNERWEKIGKPVLHTRFGIHTGETIVGNVGSDLRMNYTVLGDSVNVASRLEQANKLYGTNIIVSENTYLQTRDNCLFRPLGIVNLKGKKEGLKIYELLDMQADAHENKHRLCELFCGAIESYENQQWNDALDIFLQIKHEYPSDTPTLYFIERCARNLKNPSTE